MCVIESQRIPFAGLVFYFFFFDVGVATIFYHFLPLRSISFLHFHIQYYLYFDNESLELRATQKIQINRNLIYIIITYWMYNNEI